MQLEHQNLRFDLSHPIDLSIPVGEAVNAFHLPGPATEVVRAEGFTGSVVEGGSCNCRTITLNPHGNGTHTECIGHISKENIWVNDCLKQFHFLAQVLTVQPTEKQGRQWISTHQIKDLLQAQHQPEALIIRTWPNSVDKRQRKYSGTLPPALEPEVMDLLHEHQIRHLLVDLPSVDQEDDPNLPAHHRFFQYPMHPQRENTITELIYVPESVADGFYLLNLQVPALALDAAPSRPVLFTLVQ